MNIAVGSAFRNSAGRHLSRYVDRLDAFRRFAEAMGDTVRWIAVEGDSVDNTGMEIQRYRDQLRLNTELVRRNHGGPVFGSVEAPERMKALSYVGNGILESVKEDDDVLLYVESDLYWDSAVIYQLIAQLGPGYEIVAPLIFAGELFYDVWAFRGLDGQRFSPFKPYHSSLDLKQTTRISSAGSCLVMLASVARQCRIVDDNALVGFCADAGSKGFSVHVDPRLYVRHPA